MGRLGGLSQSSSNIGSAKVSEFQSCFDFVVTCRPKHSTHHSRGSTSEESMIISLSLASKTIGCSCDLTPDFSSLPATQLLIGRVTIAPPSTHGSLYFPRFTSAQ